MDAQAGKLGDQYEVEPIATLYSSDYFVITLYSLSHSTGLTVFVSLKLPHSVRHSVFAAVCVVTLYLFNGICHAVLAIPFLVTLHLSHCVLWQ